MVFIQKLYAVEVYCREKQLNSQERKEYWLDHAFPILEAFSSWLRENCSQVLPKSAIGKAMAYTMSRWEQLRNYLFADLIRQLKELS